MGRYSPTVLPEAFDLGSIIDQIMAGYSGGRQQKEERRLTRRQEGREDREENRYIRQLREGDLARPGAQGLAGYLEDPQAAALTEGTLARVGSAAEENVPLEFERPEPMKVQLPGGGTARMQDRAPYMMASGAVMDPGAARQEQTLGSILDMQMREPKPEKEPWKPMSRGEQVAFEGDVAAARRAPDKPDEIAPPSLSTAMSAAQAFYGRWDEDLKDYVYPFDQNRLQEIVQGVTGLEFPSIEGPTPEPEPKEEVEESGGVSFWDHVRNAVVEGQPYPKAAADTTAAGPAAPEGPTGPAAPSNDLVSRARDVRREHPDWTREQVIAELRRQDEAARRNQ